MREKWIRNAAIEAAVIGLGFGGWASRVYWPGLSGALVGISAAALAFVAITVTRHEERQEQERRVRREAKHPKPVNPAYKKAVKAA